MLTLSNIKQFKDTLEQLTFECEQLIKTRERNKMFHDADDVNDAKIARLHVPQDYYNFRLFTSFVELNKDNKGYYIYCENFVPQSKNLQTYRYGYTNQYRFPKDINFTEVEKIFHLFCIECIHLAMNENEKKDELFYIY